MSESTKLLIDQLCELLPDIDKTIISRIVKKKEQREKKQTMDVLLNQDKYEQHI